MNFSMSIYSGFCSQTVVPLLLDKHKQTLSISEWLWLVSHGEDAEIGRFPYESPKERTVTPQFITGLSRPSDTLRKSIGRLDG